MTYQWINFLFKRMMKKMIFLYLGFIVLETLAFYSVASSGIHIGTYRYEQILEMANLDILFVLALILTLGCIIWMVLELYFQSKSIYTVLQLPISSEKLFLSFLVAGIVTVLILACLQMFLVIAFGRWLPYFFTKYYEEVTGEPIPYIQGYVSLAFMRNRALSVLFPLSWNNLMYFLIWLVTPVVATIQATIALLSRKRSALLLTLLWFWILLALPNYLWMMGEEKHIIQMFLFIVTSVMVAIHGIRCIKGRELVG